MTVPLGLVLNGIDAFILVFIRLTGLFIMTPIFGRRNMPVYFKIGFSFLLALILINTIPMPKLDYYDSIYGYGFLAVKEFLVGITIGYVSYLIFSAIYVAGQIIDMQVGFGLVNVLDPISNIQAPITSNFYFIISMLVFLTIDGHHMIIRALFDSYRYIPIGGAVFNGNLMDNIIRLFSDTFVIAFKISAPVVAAILITDVAQGVITRTIPQINVFIVGMPLKIALGIVVMMIIIPMLITAIFSLTGSMAGETANFIKNMGMNK